MWYTPSERERVLHAIDQLGNTCMLHMKIMVLKQAYIIAVDTNHTRNRLLVIILYDLA